LLVMACCDVSVSEIRDPVCRISRGLLLAGTLLACVVDLAHAADWRMDPAGSKLEYIATFQKARASGTFREFDTRVRFDERREPDLAFQPDPHAANRWGFPGRACYLIAAHHTVCTLLAGR